MTPSTMPTPLVSTAWLAEQLESGAGPGPLVVVDGSWYLPSANRNPRAEFEAGHLPGAVFWDLDALSDLSSGLPHMLPGSARLSALIGGLGIGDDSRVVVYDGSGVNLSAPRIWWTLRVAGHEAVSVLDGGLLAWRAENRPLEPGPPRVVPRHFTVRFRPDLVASFGEVRSVMGSPAAQLLDARSAGRFAGTEPEPRPGLRGGHIPGAHNLPFDALTGPDGRLRPDDELRRRYAAAGIDLARPVVLSCGSGVSACVHALALERLGHRAWSVYDGSWAEWGRESGGPVER